MKDDQLEMTLYFDFYGELLTQKQRTCFDLYYNQDLSLSEIAQLDGISRQGVHDAISRAEAQLSQLEQITGCVRSARAAAQTAQRLEALARRLAALPGDEAQAIAGEIREAAASLKE